MLLEYSVVELNGAPPVGLDVGKTLGITVGATEGVSLGTAVGKSVGVREGRTVGRRVTGNLVGLGVGQAGCLQAQLQLHKPCGSGEIARTFSK